VVPLTVALDSREAAQSLSEALLRAGSTSDVLIELDVGLRRTGVANVDSALALARHVERLPQMQLAGISCFSGPVSIEGPNLVSLATMDESLTECRAAFTGGGFSTRRISAGSTAISFYMHGTSVTEMRPGNYVMLDRNEVLPDQLSLCALRILTTVVSAAGGDDMFTVDAGSKTLSDAPARDGDGRFGAFLEHPEYDVRSLYEEHGICTAGAYGSPRLGQRLQIIPNHACTCINLHESLVGVRKNVVERVFRVDARGAVR
jgi:D-serine deaminase-like pyridoxal phosphate-dependent protein